MTIYYSPSTRGFYDTGAFEYTLPDDTVAISRERLSELLAGQATGQEIVPGADGFPTLAAPPGITVEQWRETAKLSRMEMATALDAAGLLTEAEAMQFCGGTVPAPLDALIMLLPEEHRKAARFATAAGQPFERSSPLWDAVAAADTGPSEVEIDALFGWTD